MLSFNMVARLIGWQKLLVGLEKLLRKRKTRTRNEPWQTTTLGKYHKSDNQIIIGSYFINKTLFSMINEPGVCIFACGERIIHHHGHDPAHHFSYTNCQYLPPTTLIDQLAVHCRKVDLEASQVQHRFHPDDH